ncbi:MAG: M14 family metallopeptidase [Anaerolineae bacterium]
MRPPSWTALFCIVCFGVILSLTPTFYGGTSNAASPEQRLVWLRAKTSQQVQQWVDGGLDVWQVEGDRVLAQVSQNQLGRLKAHAVDFQPAPLWGTPAFPACYRKYSDLVVFFHQMQADYPNLFRLFDVGDSWETAHGLANRNIYAARLTNHNIRTEKPKLFVTAEHHAREIITSEAALMFIEDLLLKYAQDPQIRWLLDNREIWVMPMTNPDGHERAVQLADWRKNTNRPELCPNGQPPFSYGVDLNRNYGYQWGLDIGSSSEPCNLTYRGSAPFSEPETQAIRDVVQQERFDLLLSLHAYGDAILYPWGYTDQPAPDAENLRRIADRLAQASGYEAMQSWGIGYLSSGDTTDWTYGELGIPSFTVEIGGIEDGAFWPDCTKRQELFDEVRDALVYAAMIADAPYERANGPDVRQLTWGTGEEIILRAQADDTWNGGEGIAQIELFFDTLGEPGTGIQAVPADGEFNAAREWGLFQLEPSDVPPGATLMILCARDARGHWGPPKVAAVPWSAQPTPTITPTATLPPHGPTPTPTPPTMTPPATPTATPVPPSPTPTPTKQTPWRPTNFVYFPLIYNQ